MCFYIKWPCVDSAIGFLRHCFVLCVCVATDIATAAVAVAADDDDAAIVLYAGWLLHLLALFVVV